MKFSFFGFTFLLCLIAPPAFAYIDPGMGSMWIQGIIALGAGFLVTLRMYWQRFKLFLFGPRKKRETDIMSKNEVNSAVGNKLDR